MNLREKALAVLSGQEAYPVPVDVWENAIHPVLENKLCAFFGLKEGDHEGVLRKLNACMRWGSPVYTGPALENADIDVPARFPCKKVVKNIWGTWDGIETYTDTFKRPLADADTIAQIDAHKWPAPDWFDYHTLCWLSDAREKKTPIGQWSVDHANFLRLVGGWNPIFSRVMDLFGIEQGLMNIAADRKLIEATLGHIEEFYIGFYTRVAQASKGFADIIGFGDDFAGQTNLLIAPKVWRELFLPIWRRLFAIAHKNGMKTMMHMCGNIRPVLGDLIDAGLDIYENLQINTLGMSLQSLKNEFGKDIAFYGGIDVQGILPYASSQEVKEEVCRFADIMGKGGKYILASTHFLLEDIPGDNVIAMYEAAAEYMG